ncbi:hypothetical protein LAZ67_3004897 [Cordylochernes scorpioides]|uniref:RNA-directed DNA polymerase n=1 Tax=Cordylochernes scorpioides TaxID=51811 RepID=A0ABY6K9T6_9ARAC|nr:hypothetical protein LAZ67_3004897 [Cordylochernes scorpioides]
METENKPSDTSEICKVSVKIPPFWVEKPEIWFFQVEAQFKIGGIIQEDTKFNYLISQLEPKYIENIWDIINSKSDNKYSECKSRLLELFRESEGLRIKKLISGIELGDMKPSQLLQKLRSLATPDISDNLIKTLWLDKLPTSIKNILIVSEEDISKLAIMADKINEINSSKEIYDAEVPSSSTDRLIAKLEDLERQVSVQLERVGKPQPADRVATSSSAGIQDCRNLRLFMTDKNTGLRFLVDSGADISIIPPKDKNRMPISDYKLYAANGTEIVTYGTKVRNLDIGLRRQFQWPFVIANTNRAIIGADFLNNFGLIIDIKNKRLIDGITNLSIRGVIQSISDMGNISTLYSSSKVSAILTKYPNLCRPPSYFVEAKHSVKHYIPTRGQPIHSKARRLDSQRLTLAKAEFQYMLNNGIIRPSNSPWASPLHLVSKKDESLRPCGDYRRLNAVTLPDRYPIPRLDDFHHILKGTRVYSKIDLCKAFYQIPIAEEDKPKTAIITPFGLFEFNVMSFGLRNATATFQRFMHEVLRNLDFAFVYLDDILVASKTEEEHYSHLETLFSRLNSYGLRINLSKSKFLVQEIDFLGYLITSHGVKPLPTKVKAILEYKKPKTVHELRIFLGMLNFYCTFLNNAAETQAILHEYLRGAKKKDRSEIKWSEEAEVQFEKCKQALANTALLAYPDTELPISLCTDASDRAVGSVLQQLDNNNWKPIAFFSKKLNPAQCNYSTYDRELLAIYLSIKFFKHLLEAREFTILTDHKPLIYAFKQKNEKASPRQLRHLQYISQFTTDIKFIKGTDNIVADALSRVDAITTIDYEEIAKEQTGDSELQNLISKNTSLKFKQCPLQSGNLLWCDVSTNNIRPFIPIKFRMMVFRNFHELSHPGIKATTKQLTSRFIWPNMNKTLGNGLELVSTVPKVQDLIGALPPSNGNIYCLTCIDRYTSWMEVVPLPDMKSETVARAFYENCIVRFGAPHTVISDQGKQFTSQLFKDLTTLCGIKLRHSTAYHPQCNGKIERLHRTIKTAIRAHNSIKWTETLPTVLLGLRAVCMVYGKTIRLPGEFFDDSKHHLHAEEFVQQLQKQMELLKPLNEKHHSKTKVFVHKDLKTCSHVFIRTDRVKKPLEPPYEGPFPVLERTDKYFTLKVKGKNVTTSIDRLRPAYLLADSDNITAEHPAATRPIVSGALPSTSSQQKPDPPDVEKYTEFQGTGSAPDLTRTRSGRIIKKPIFFFLISTLGEVECSCLCHQDWDHTQWQAYLAPKKMATSDMRKRRHVQPLLTWSTNSCCIPGLGALTGYYQPGQLSPGILVSLLLLPLLHFHPGLEAAKCWTYGPVQEGYDVRGLAGPVVGEDGAVAKAGHVKQFRHTHLHSRLHFTCSQDVGPPQEDEDGDLEVHRGLLSLELEHAGATRLAQVGLQVWSGALLMADFLLSRPLTAEVLLELGSGIGLCSLLAAPLASTVLCTDISQEGILETSLRNVESNGGHNVLVRELDWKTAPSSGLLTDAASPWGWSPGDVEKLRQVTTAIAADACNHSLQVSSSQFVKAGVVADLRPLVFSDMIYDNTISQAFLATLIWLQTSFSLTTVFLTTEKRINFSLDILDETAVYYDFFFSELQSKYPQWRAVLCPQDFPQCSSLYERSSLLVGPSSHPLPSGHTATVSRSCGGLTWGSLHYTPPILGNKIWFYRFSAALMMAL